MEILAYGEDGTPVTIDAFFAKFSEFSVNPVLAQQIVRYLKVLSRHPRAEVVDKITDKCSDGYKFCVSGLNQTYTVTFQMKSNCIMLQTLE